MSAHTPGPWSVGFSDGTGPTYIIAGGHPTRREGVAVTVVSGATDDWGIPQGVTNPANARLIAAAPELLKACRLMVDVITVDSGLEGKDDEYIYDTIGSVMASGYFMARDAIAKAVQS